jgi:hypothetical protein
MIECFSIQVIVVEPVICLNRHAANIATSAKAAFLDMTTTVSGS